MADTDSEHQAGRRAFMASGGQVVGQVAGAALGVMAGPLAGAGAAAVLGEVLSRAGAEFHDRVLSPRQSARAAGALDVATVRIKERLDAGDEPRGDGFFDPGADGRADAEEVLEGTLITAANAWEQRKVAPLGRLYANLGFEPSVSPAYANYLLRLADRLSYRQLVLLAFFAEAERPGPYESAVMHLTAMQSEDGGSPDRTLYAEMNGLSDTRLLGLRQNDGSVIPPAGVWEGAGTGWKPSMLVEAGLDADGLTLYRLMELDSLPRGDLDGVLAGLRGD